MDVSKLTTTIVSGVLALSMIIGTVVLLTAGQPVPDYFPPTLALLIGAAVGSARAAS